MKEKIRITRLKSREIFCQGDYKKILLAKAFPLYYEEGWSLRTKGNIFSYQYRKYRTWKYNRKTQWK
jgi:hypothetical protein